MQQDPKSLTLNRSKRADRENRVLLSLVELYLKTGKPIGSHTLRDHGFGELSPATIRNYFAKLEERGLLMQQHSSGGRIPTNAAFRLYAETSAQEPLPLPSEIEKLTQGMPINTKEPTAFLFKAAERLSHLTGYAVCLSTPRFDHDFILDIKLVAVDSHRCACILLTDFGLVKTEVLHTESRLSSFSLKRIEGYFLWHLRGTEKPPGLTPTEEKIAKHFYEEVMIRYIVNYGNFSQADVLRSGFSLLLHYPEFNDPIALANGLSLFENGQALHRMLAECQERSALIYWIGEELAPYSPNTAHCSMICIPYRINQSCVGAIGLLGPTRMPYRKLFTLLRFFSEHLTEVLTASLYKFKLQYRQPDKNQTYLQQSMGGQSSQNLLESKNHSGARHE